MFSVNILACFFFLACSGQNPRSLQHIQIIVLAVYLDFRECVLLILSFGKLELDLCLWWHCFEFSRKEREQEKECAAVSTTGWFIKAASRVLPVQAGTALDRRPVSTATQSDMRTRCRHENMESTGNTLCSILTSLTSYRYRVYVSCRPVYSK